MATVSYFFVKKINKKTLDQPADKFRFVLQELIAISLKLSYNKAWLVKLRAHLPSNIVSKHQRNTNASQSYTGRKSYTFKGERTWVFYHAYLRSFLIVRKVRAVKGFVASP